MFKVALVKGLFKAHSALHKRSLLSSSITIKSQARWIYYYIFIKKNNMGKFLGKHSQCLLSVWEGLDKINKQVIYVICIDDLWKCTLALTLHVYQMTHLSNQGWLLTQPPLGAHFGLISIRMVT